MTDVAWEKKTIRATVNISTERAVSYGLRVPKGRVYLQGTFQAELEPTPIEGVFKIVGGVGYSKDVYCKDYGDGRTTHYRVIDTPRRLRRDYVPDDSIGW